MAAHAFPEARGRAWHRASAARGFTLIEAMVVVGMVAILSTVAAPSFRSFIGTMNSRTAAFDLISDLSMARSEAIKRNQQVVLQPVVAGDWSKGWRVVSGGAVLRERGELASSLAIAAAPASLQFRPNGRLADEVADGNLAWSISSTISGVGARCVVITPTGSARSKAGTCA
ncbi:GspH/FimT family pseudopilin [Caldimonas tepidiphila]|uniref:GspH/FimT family pseudopilin n=1 Tax=Caldimonas tepidiphila TaxID=2315841 RepID=UPI000E5AE9F6|nr:GspH/FimT family pseudopilin [Caldimonas tepidiphila]